ncbi:response regulator, partial [Salmonella sp. SAL4458]|uniref:response regulator n=1 Tax=Salmonella sp. SAL4458 TaxID=3159913 RepID=UPI00397E1ED8
LNRTKEFIDRPVKKLLLVEDDDNQRMSLSELMRSEQDDVTAVGTAESALEVIQSRQFDCAVVDLGLPDLPGAELIERMRKTKGGEELP